MYITCYGVTAARTYTVHKRHAEDASVGKYYFPFVLVSGYVGTIDRGVLFLTVVGWLIGVVLDVQSEGEEEERSATATRIHLHVLFSSMESILCFLSTFPTLLVTDVLLTKPGKTLVGPRTVRLCEGLYLFTRFQRVVGPEMVRPQHRRKPSLQWDLTYRHNPLGYYYSR